MFYELFLEFEEKEQSLESDMMKQLEETDETFENELRHIDEQAMQDYEEYGRDEEFYEDDPEWKTIEPLVERIMRIIPMEKIQGLWESGEIDQIIELITSETDLSHDEAKRVVAFFEKYEDREYDEEHYYEEEHRKYDFEKYDYSKSQPTDDEQVLRLEQRIAELEEENQMLLETIEELEEKIIQINAVLTEQVKFIYEGVQSQ